MSLLKRIEDGIEHFHLHGYASQLPESVTALLKHIAGEVDALRDELLGGRPAPTAEAGERQSVPVAASGSTATVVAPGTSDTSGGSLPAPEGQA